MGVNSSMGVCATRHTHTVPDIKEILNITYQSDIVSAMQVAEAVKARSWVGERMMSPNLSFEYNSGIIEHLARHQYESVER